MREKRDGGKKERDGGEREGREGVGEREGRERRERRIVVYLLQHSHSSKDKCCKVD